MILFIGFGMTDFNVGEKRGKIILHTGSMNGGKSSELVEIGMRGDWDRFKCLAFIPTIDTRSNDKISAMDGKLEYPACRISEIHPEDILRVIKEEDKKGKVDAVIIDEVNFFNMNIVRVIEKLRDTKRAVIIGGLDYNFRGEPFGPTHLIKSIADEIYLHYPSCSIAFNGKTCSKPAKYTVRLIKSGNEKEIIRFQRKKGEIVLGYKWAPYYSPTVVVEGSQENVAYCAACPDCYTIPRKKETLEVQDFITKQNGVNEKEFSEKFRGLHDLGTIVGFLLDEKRIIERGGVYLPQAYVKDSFIPGNYLPLNV